MGEPVAELAAFEHEASAALLVRIRRAIQRRTAVAQLTSFSASVPLVVLREFWLILIEQFNPNSVRPFALDPGATVGQFAGQMATQAAEFSGIDSAPALGRLVSALIVFIVGMMAIGQLKIDTEMVRIVTSFFLAAGALAFGLAFGLGTREIVRNIVAGFYTRKILAVGENLEIAGQTGILTAITSTHAILSDQGRDILVANATFLTETSKQ
jgi:small-conductance mechanosensitive channel